ncbi:Protein Wnt-7b-like protein [Leptotrombidium deliense]|uniref:Protein Wnt n=1 Tax=Leptotrombidium deliense TaxID=299467 RepID=A0A443SN25_9ACAR|nr:Protein Wnt-7b-like protein [Leptotrombidium deliense]
MIRNLQAVKNSLETTCKCHGVSGSCTTKTCWKSLPHFNQLGDYLMKRYLNAKKVTLFDRIEKQRKSDEFQSQNKPRDLIYIENSPNYCEANYALGSYGTVSRACNRSSIGSDSCDLMCCGRGYNTHHYTRTWQCHCKFMWCCHVSCKICNEKVEAYTCK